MNTYGKKLICLLAVVLLMLPLQSWFPLSVQASVSQVKDQAGLLSDEEVTSLTGQMERLEAEWKQAFVIVTTRDAQGKDSEAYADDYYDSHGYGENGVLFLIDLDNGQIWISTAGAMIRFLTDSRIEKVLDAGYEALHAGQYARGLEQMLDATEGFLREGIPAGSYRFDPETGNVGRYRSVGMMDVLLGAAAGLAAGCILFFAVRSRYRSKSGSISYSFHNQGNLTLTRQEDHFVNQVVTRRKIPKSPPSSGGGGSSVHRSSGGVRHGGGGRSL